MSNEMAFRTELVTERIALGQNDLRAGLISPSTRHTLLYHCSGGALKTRPASDLSLGLVLPFRPETCLESSQRRELTGKGPTHAMTSSDLGLCYCPYF